MHDYFLTKSDFKVARTCPTKLYYRKKGYPTTEAGDEQLALMADQGYLVEALARTLYPEGRWIGYRQDVESAAWDTMSALSENTTLFEATFISGGKMARVDILIRRGNVLELIEIKARGFNRQKNDELIHQGLPNLFHSPKTADGIRNEWRPYLEDAAFQTGILQELFPKGTIIPYLLLPDSSQPCQFDGLHRRFTLRSFYDGRHSTPLPPSDYTADLRDLSRSPLLVKVNVADEVHLLMPDVTRRATEHLRSLHPALTRIVTPPSTNCRDCEFRVPEGKLRGFHDCWGDIADVKPHILDLYRVRDVGNRNQPVADKLIAQGRACLYDFPERLLTRRDGSIGKHSQRQRLQIRHTKANREWFSDELGAFIGSLVFPLHFVDFETCAPAIPRYRGMRPFETLAFQWSCHTITSPDAQPHHTDWIQSADTFPNASFVGALRHKLGDRGSILVWSAHEATVLRTIQRQLIERGDRDSETAHWLGRLLNSDRLVDLNQKTLEHYFHPRMGGRTSLKVVADAVWQANPGLRDRLPQYLMDTGDEISSPYHSLSPILIGGRQIAVAEGVGAVLAYYEMMNRYASNDTLEAEQWRKLLYQYCELDTMAMVMVWWHWRHLTVQVKQQD